MSKYKPYTMIGSRSTPDHIKELMVRIATKLCEKGYTGRSGGADGADAALEEGYIIHQMNNQTTPCSYLMEIYLPWMGFNGRDERNPPYYIPSNFSNYQAAVELAEEIHPAWDRCSRGGKSLHSRNCYQLLGKDLDTPSKFVICYAEPKNNNPDCHDVKGGTGTAVRLGLKHGVTILNLYHQDVIDRMNKFLEE